MLPPAERLGFARREQRPLDSFTQHGVGFDSTSDWSSRRSLDHVNISGFLALYKLALGQIDLGSVRKSFQ